MPAKTLQLAAPRARKDRVWQALAKRAFGNHALALIDQAIVSGLSFLTLIMVARFTETAALGAFAIANSFLGVLIALQHSLIAQPYTIQRHDQPEIVDARAFCSLLQCWICGAAAALVALVTAGVLTLLNVSGDVATTLLVLAVLAPFVLTKELIREFSFAHFKLPRALFLDAAAAFIQLAILGWAAATGRMSVLMALASIGISSGLIAAVWLLIGKTEFSFDAGRFRELLSQSCGLGKWLTLSRAATLIQGYGPYWISGSISGAAVTGLYAACMSIVSLANPLLMGLYNFLTPRSAAALKDGGHSELLRRTLRDTALLAAVMGAFCVAIAVAGDAIMYIIYHRDEYQGHTDVLTILGLAALVSALGIPASTSLAVMGTPRALAAITGGSAVISLALVALLLNSWGLVGAAYGILTGNVMWTTGRWCLLVRVLRRQTATLRTA